MGKEEKAAGNISAERLQAYLERVERLEDEKKGLGDDIKDIYTEAKNFGYDTPTMRSIVRLRRMDAAKRAEADALLETYRAAIGI